MKYTDLWMPEIKIVQVLGYLACEIFLLLNPVLSLRRTSPVGSFLV